MQDHPTNRAERQTSARILAIELNNRAWELIERRLAPSAKSSKCSTPRMAVEHGGRAWRSSMAVEHERAHERDHGGAVGHFDQAMTLVAMQLASLKLPGAPRVEPRRAAHGLDGDLAYNPPSRRTRRALTAAPLATMAFSADSLNGARRGLSTWARPERMGRGKAMGRGRSNGARGVGNRNVGADRTSLLRRPSAYCDRGASCATLRRC